MSEKFQADVLNLVQQIPKGRVTTYGELARALTGSARAARAVGQAVGKNPALVRIPCHRVVRSDGAIGGYKLGVAEKIKLLNEEGFTIRSGKVVNFQQLLFRFDAAETPRFLTDRMLGKLSTWLRILGHDTVYAADIVRKEGERREEEEDEDNALAAFAAREARILLTRDKELATSAKKNGVHCVQINTDEVMAQLKELLSHNLKINLQPRPVGCSECNALIRKVKAGEANLLKAKDYVPVHMIGTWDFWICEHCGRVYWEGSHWRDMRERLQPLNELMRSGV
ncbi:MAG TPA: methylated-DNA--[protein]-cysteine S-methyltransferase [Desulfobacteria bacterium]|nr:methylated-DNA--[protein]-cysteine S-methyltransferase [Desulfobacteria bacterium]